MRPYRGKPKEDIDLDIFEYGIDFRDGFVYGNLIFNAGSPYIIGDVIDSCEEYIALEWWVPVDPSTVGQHTGLNDKNGKEIYEGDIVRQAFHLDTRDDEGYWISFQGHHIGVVCILPSKGVCMKNPLKYSVETDETESTKQYKNVSAKRSEIIGNIHDNPELLEGE